MSSTQRPHESCHPPLTSEMLSETGGIPFGPHEKPEIGNASGQLAGLSLRLLQPERHVHLAVHGHAASAPGAASVRVWQTTSMGSEARDRRNEPSLSTSR